MSILQSILNSRVVSIDSQDECTHLEFSNGNTLNIFNSSSITPAGADLTGLTLTSITEGGKIIVLIFDSKIKLEVSLEDRAYNGPEALSHIDSTGRITVWN